MKYLISHRGNLFGRNIIRENTVEYIESAISQGFDVMIDIWINSYKIYLGNDEPEYQINIEFLLNNKNKLLCNARNYDALLLLKDYNIHCFTRQTDDTILTSNGLIIKYKNNKDTVFVINDDGICSNNIVQYL